MILWKRLRLDFELSIQQLTTFHTTCTDWNLKKNKKKNKKNPVKLYCSFIDFRKAFDSVWRVRLWMKLFKNGKDGSFRIIRSLYKNIKSCIYFYLETSQVSSKITLEYV